MATKKSKAKANRVKKVKALVIRTCNADGTSHSGFVWPESGHVAAPDWDATPDCGHGLHGLIDGVGNYSHLSDDASARWQIVEVDRAKCVDLGDKVKFPEGVVVYSGRMGGALSLISKEWIRIACEAARGGVATKTEECAAAQGDSGHAAAQGDSGHAAAQGYRGHAAAQGDSGHAAAQGYRGHAAAQGYRGHAAAQGYSGHAAAQGDSGHAAAQGDSGHAAAQGYRGHAAAQGKHGIAIVQGLNGTALAGELGIVILPYWSESEQRQRVAVGYVGENGIEAGVVYCVNKTGQLEAKK